MHRKDEAVLERRPLRLELGCGHTKRDPGAVGVDLLDAPCVDVVGDALDVLRALPDGSVAGIYSEHFLEHVPDAEIVVAEAARVLEPGGSFVAVVPHFSNPHFYSDPTHRIFFGLYTFAYWVQSSPFRRQVPQYRKPLPLSYDRATYVFKSAPPFWFRHVFKKLLGSWVNSSRWSQEFYEEMVSPVFPCYEVRYELTKV